MLIRAIQFIAFLLFCTSPKLREEDDPTSEKKREVDRLRKAYTQPNATNSTNMRYHHNQQKKNPNKIEQRTIFMTFYVVTENRTPTIQCLCFFHLVLYALYATNTVVTRRKKVYRSCNYKAKQQSNKFYDQMCAMCMCVCVCVRRKFCAIASMAFRVSSNVIRTNIGIILTQKMRLCIETNRLKRAYNAHKHIHTVSNHTSKKKQFYTENTESVKKTNRK